MDPSKVDWDNPSVKYLLKHFEETTKARDEENEQLREQLRQVSGELEQLREQLRQVSGELEQLREENREAAAAAGQNKKHGSGRSHNHRSYNVRNMNGYPRIKKGAAKGDGGTKRSSHRVPPAVNDTRQADQLRCPHCNILLSNSTAMYDRLSEDLIDFKWTVTDWDVTRRFCRHCNKQITPKLDGVLPGEHFGINIMAMVQTMRCENISIGKIQKLVYMFHGVTIAESTLNHFCDVVSRELEPLYDRLKMALKRYKVINGDETGWFVNGKRRWVWAFVSSGTVIFTIEKSRGSKVPIEVLGEFNGIMASDSWGPWNHVGSAHQKCLLHYFRDMYKTLKKNKSKAFARFFKSLYRILKDAIQPRETDRRETAEDKRRSVQRLQRRVRMLIKKDYKDKDCKRYVKRLKREIGALFTFIEHEDVDFHNNISEQALRVFAEARKILYGSRTEKGAKRTAITMSIYATCNKRGVNFYEFLRDYLDGKIDSIPNKRRAPAAKTITTMTA